MPRWVIREAGSGTCSGGCGVTAGVEVEMGLQGVALGGVGGRSKCSSWMQVFESGGLGGVGGDLVHGDLQSWEAFSAI